MTECVMTNKGYTPETWWNTWGDWGILYDVVGGALPAVLSSHEDFVLYGKLRRLRAWWRKTGEAIGIEYGWCD